MQISDTYEWIVLLIKTFTSPFKILRNKRISSVVNLYLQMCKHKRLFCFHWNSINIFPIAMENHKHHKWIFTYLSGSYFILINLECYMTSNQNDCSLPTFCAVLWSLVSLQFHVCRESSCGFSWMLQRFVWSFFFLKAWKCCGVIDKISISDK